MSKKEIEAEIGKRVQGAKSFGWNMTKGDDNEARRKRIAKLREDLKTTIDTSKGPLATIDELETRAQIIGGVISEVAAEKLRAGSTDQNSEMLRWYHKIETTVISDLNLSRIFVNGIMQGTISSNGNPQKTQNDKDRKLSISQAHVSHLITMIYKEVVSRALLVIDRSWLDIDVAAKDVYIFTVPISSSIRPGAGLDQLANPTAKDEY